MKRALLEKLSLKHCITSIFLAILMATPFIAATVIATPAYAVVISSISVRGNELIPSQTIRSSILFSPINCDLSGLSYIWFPSSGLGTERQRRSASPDGKQRFRNSCDIPIGVPKLELGNEYQTQTSTPSITIHHLRNLNRRLHAAGQLHQNMGSQFFRSCVCLQSQRFKNRVHLRFRQLLAIHRHHHAPQ